MAHGSLRSLTAESGNICINSELATTIQQRKCVPWLLRVLHLQALRNYLPHPSFHENEKEETM